MIVYRIVKKMKTEGHFASRSLFIDSFGFGLLAYWALGPNNMIFF